MRPPPTTVAAAVAGACMLALLPARAAQPTTSDVEKLIKRGNELRTAQRDQEALPFFQQAYELVPTPRTSAQLGLCEMALNYWLAADAHLSEALAGRGDWIDRNRATIESSLRETQKRIGEVIVTGSPVGASVRFNGRIVGSLPLAPVRVVAGALRVEVTAPGYKPGGDSVMAVGGGRETVTIHLASDVMVVPPVVHPSSGSPGWSAGRVAGAVLLGAGILSVAGGATMLLFDKRESCDSPAGGHCSERVNTRIPGWTLIGAGVAVGALGGFLVYDSPTATAAVGVSPASIVVAGRF